MQIINQDFRKGIVRLRVTDSEDLWYLSHLIDAKDIVTAKTSRKIKIGDGENAKTAKKYFIVTIEAETVDLEPETNSLRINGTIREGPEFAPAGSHQSISLELDSEFSLEKKQWMSYQKQKLVEAAQKKYSYLICLLDREEALFALTKKSGYEILTKLKGDVPKKAQANEVKNDFYLEIFGILESYFNRYHPEQVILASPAFYKEELYKKIGNKELKQKIALATCSDVVEASLDEVIKSPELRKVLEHSRAREEKVLIDELLKEINTEGLAAYGWKEVISAVEQGAVEKLILTEEFIRKRKTASDKKIREKRVEDKLADSSGFMELDQLMKKVDDAKGEVHILSSENEAGRKLDGLGGIGALLRFKKW
ncbi:mRNA surveillance protein pelota [Candidatus Woesearchaeota archaeon]|nr:mRNA surveillance protein pelota [Candidatus Woesearchaeota archaeon]